MCAKIHYIGLICVLAALSLTHGAPSMRQHKRRHIECAVNQSESMWYRSCGYELHFRQSNASNNNTGRIPKPLKPLRGALPGFIVRLNDIWPAIETGDISEWVALNSMYEFLPQINSNTTKICLRKRHIETQLYVAAFQYLWAKQKKHDCMVNDDPRKTIELDQFQILAKNLLCELETAIMNMNQKKPKILTRDDMDKRLTFRNNNRDRKRFREVDDMDSKFAIVRFSEHLHGLSQVLKNRQGRTNQRNKNAISKRIVHPVKPESLGRNEFVALPSETQSTIDKALFDQTMRNSDNRQPFNKGKKNHQHNGRKRKGKGRRNQHLRRGKSAANNSISSIFFSSTPITPVRQS